MWVAFGALCVTAGVKLGNGGRPFWVNDDATERVTAVVLGAPAAWLIVALLLSAAAYAGTAGWSMVVQPGATGRDAALGVAVMTVAVAATWVARRC